MTIPANLNAESSRWGSIPVTACWGPQSGPYTPANTGQGLPIQGSQADGQTGSAVNPVLTGRLDGNGNIQSDNGNQAIALLPSATRTATTSSAPQTNTNARGVLLYINVTAASGTGGLQVVVQTPDPVSNSWLNYGSFTAAITTVGESMYVLYPTAFANQGGNVKTAVGLPLPATWRVSVTPADSSNYTYSIGASLIV